MVYPPCVGGCFLPQKIKKGEREHLPSPLWAQVLFRWGGLGGDACGKLYIARVVPAFSEVPVVAVDSSNFNFASAVFVPAGTAKIVFSVPVVPIFLLSVLTSLPIVVSVSVTVYFNSTPLVVLYTKISRTPCRFQRNFQELTTNNILSNNNFGCCTVSTSGRCISTIFIQGSIDLFFSLTPASITKVDQCRNCPLISSQLPRDLTSVILGPDPFAARKRSTSRKHRHCADGHRQRGCEEQGGRFLRQFHNPYSAMGPAADGQPWICLLLSHHMVLLIPNSVLFLLSTLPVLPTARGSAHGQCQLYDAAVGLGGAVRKIGLAHHIGRVLAGGKGAGHLHLCTYNPGATRPDWNSSSSPSSKYSPKAM